MFLAVTSDSPKPSPGIPQDLLDNILKATDIPSFAGQQGAASAPTPKTSSTKKWKILWLSDHPLAVSGVGTQSRFLIEGLLATGKYSFQCLGGAIKHERYELIQPKPDWIIKPVDGFGTKPMIRDILLTERPDAVFLFTDPRQFVWLWEMEDEIRQICPIVYWHVWDNGPYPEYNNPWYESTDLINCISWKTHELVSPRFPEKTNYIPHGLPKVLYHRLPTDTVEQFKAANLGSRKDHFIALWVNRNATRKMPNDVLWGWKMFLDRLEEKYGHKDALLLMHTEPTDPEGPNLLAVTDQLGIFNHVWFSNQAQPFEAMNMLHNVADVTVNIAKAEGFSLSSLSSLTVGKPVINLMTGGLQRQVVDWRDGYEHGVALPVRVKSLVGSQMTPYIYEDFCSVEDLADAFMKIYEMTPAERQEMSQRCEAYANFEFNYDDVVRKWDETLSSCITRFKESKKSGENNNRWSLAEVPRLKVATGPNSGGVGAKQSPPRPPPPQGLQDLVLKEERASTEVAGDITSVLRSGISKRRKEQQQK